MTDQLSMCDQKTLMDSRNVISSQALLDGASQLDLLAGLTIESSGPVAAHASRSASPAKVMVTKTQGIYGPTFSDSLPPEGPLRSWENRLRQRLARIGSTECSLTWKASVTPAGRPLSRLVPSMPHTVEIDCGLLLEAAYWITATTRDWKDSPEMALERQDGRSRIDQLPRPVVAAMYATPTSLAPARNGQNEAGNSAWLVAIRKVALAMYPTATAVDGARGLTTRPQDTGKPLPQVIGQMLGMPPSGSLDTTEKRGGLNPAFVCWLMGFPPAWESCAPMAMPSSRKKRPK